MYACRVEKRVWRNPERNSGYSRLVFNVEVESAQKVGLELNEGSWFSGPVKFVVWDMDNEPLFAGLKMSFLFTIRVTISPMTGSCRTI